MAEVIDLQAKRIERSPGINGPARCLRCDYRWQEVKPADGKVTGLPCPACRCLTGSLIALFSPTAGEVVLTCACGNQHFLITRRGTHCVNCGLTMSAI